MVASSSDVLSPMLNKLTTYLSVDDFENNVALGTDCVTKTVASVLRRKGESSELVYQPCQQERHLDDPGISASPATIVASRLTTHD
jgi:hypothetical protein